MNVYPLSSPIQETYVMDPSIVQDVSCCLVLDFDCFAGVVDKLKYSLKLEPDCSLRVYTFVPKCKDLEILNGINVYNSASQKVCT